MENFIVVNLVNAFRLKNIVMELLNVLMEMMNYCVKKALIFWFMFVKIVNNKFHAKTFVMELIIVRMNPMKNIVIVLLLINSNFS